MLSKLINERGHIPVANIVQPPADQRITLIGQIANRRREVELAVKPRLHRVLVRGHNIHQVSGLERSNMARHELLGNQIALASI